MPFDAIFMSCLKGEIEARTVGNKIDKIQQPDRDTVVFGMRSGRLLISLRSSGGRVSVTDESFENPSAPPMFCMLLRKYLLGGRIVSLTQPGLERSYDFEIETYDMLGAERTLHLIVELLGRYTNLILADENMNIIDCTRRIGFDVSDKRQVLPGLLYRLPPETGKLDPRFTEKERFFVLLSENTDKRGDKFFNIVFDGFSPLVCREMCNRAYGYTDLFVSEMIAKDKGEALWKCFSSLMEAVKSGKTSPCLISDSEGKPYDFCYTDIRQYGNTYKTEIISDFSRLLSDFYSKRDRLDRMRTKTQAIYKNIKRLRDRAERRVGMQKKDLLLTKDRETFRENGDLLTSNLYRMKKGMTSIVVDDFYSENGGQREIKLDPLKTPQQNAADYYKSYTKAKTAEIHLKEQIDKGELETEYLGSVLDALDRAETEKDILEIKQELTSYGYFHAPKGAKKEKQISQQPMHFVSTNGVDIYAGKNNMQNDRLTMKTALHHDMWLHVQKLHGSHVIISAGGADPDDKTLLEAAIIAATYSEGRDGGKIPVDYTKVRYVKKPAGAKAGMVIYTDYNTLFVAPDEELCNKLKVK